MTSLRKENRDDLVYTILPFRPRQPVKLLVYLPLIQEMAEGHEPHLSLRPVQQRRTVKNKPGKQLLVPQGTFSCACGTIHLVAYPAKDFFAGPSSLSMYRFVPLNIASMIASL